MKNQFLTVLIFSLTIFFSSCDRENHFGLHQEGNNYTGHYAWYYRNHLYNLDLKFPVDLYWHYRNQPKTLPYEDYVREDKGYEYLNYVCGELNKLMVCNHLSDKDVVGFVSAFIQQAIPYQYDPPGPTDYPRYMIETLCDLGGDCEDKAAAICSILITYNIDAILIQVPGHEALAVACKNCNGIFIMYNSKKYFVLESTQSGWYLGAAPDNIRYANQITILPVEETAFFDRHKQRTAY